MVATFATKRLGLAAKGVQGVIGKHQALLQAKVLMNRRAKRQKIVRQPESENALETAFTDSKSGPIIKGSDVLLPAGVTNNVWIQQLDAAHLRWGKFYAITFQELESVMLVINGDFSEEAPDCVPTDEPSRTSQFGNEPNLKLCMLLKYDINEIMYACSKEISIGSHGDIFSYEFKYWECLRALATSEKSVHTWNKYESTIYKKRHLFPL